MYSTHTDCIMYSIYPVIIGDDALLSRCLFAQIPRAKDHSTNFISTQQNINTIACHCTKIKIDIASIVQVKIVSSLIQPLKSKILEIYLY